MGSEKKIQNIGILGGTFDPLHEGHMTVARTVLQRYRLDRILFVPAFMPPHKGRSLTAFSHRVAMLEAALKNEMLMGISTLEAERNGPSYTVETLRVLHGRMPSNRFYLIMGADMFAEIELWYRYEKLFELADIIVVARPGIQSEVVAAKTEELPFSFDHDAEHDVWVRTDGARIFFCNNVSLSISSSEIRRRLAEGLPVSGIVPQPVQQYIQEHGLYGCTDARH